MDRAIDRALKWAREKGWNQSEFARQLGVVRQTVNNWTSADIPLRWLLPVAQILGRTVEELSYGTNARESLGFGDGSNVEPIRQQQRRIPMLSFVQAGELTECFPEEVTEWVTPINSRPSAKAFALRVQGDSMVSEDGRQPSFPDGSTLIVDPERGPQPGDFVIAKDVATQRATFKKLTGDGVTFYLRPLNPAYPTYEIDDPSLRVIGVVVEAFHSIRF